jgi:hypothetical protein
MTRIQEQRANSRFNYIHAACGGPVTKEPTGHFEKLYHGLHGWTCTACNAHGVKVERHLKPKVRV